MDQTENKRVKCPGCGMFVIPLRYWHESGDCGIVNRAKSRVPHWHLYCPRSLQCFHDWIEESEDHVDTNGRKITNNK